MTIFGTGDYSYRPTTLSARVSLPSTLFTPSTCFTPRLTSSAVSHKTPFSRYDRSHSTPLRSLRSESPGYFYNRAVSEFSIPHLERKKSLSCSSTILTDQDRPTLRPLNLSEEAISDNMKSPKLRTKKFSTLASSSRFSYPMSSKIQKDHIARYSQRIKDIFEKDEEEINEEEASIKPFSKYAATRNCTSVFVPKSSYHSVLEDAKLLEAKYKKMNDEVEEKRPKTDLDHLRPSRHNYCPPSSITPFSKEYNRINQPPNNLKPAPSSEHFRPSLSDRTLQLYRDASTPSPCHGKATYNNNIINPTRYLAANLRTAIYNRSSMSSDPDPMPLPYKMPSPCPSPPSDQPPALPCGLRRRYTNRETKLARQTLEYIMKGERWTSTVERPFVLGI